MERELQLYFHIPFCVKKCFYCDFLSAPGEKGAKEEYMKALLAETAGSALSYGDYKVTSVFIGGGTPSVIPACWLEELMDTVRNRYRLYEDAEISIEVNPGTASREWLGRMRRAGINRLSIGLQSAHDEELALLGRIHTWRQFEEVYGAAREAGFDNVNVDVMSALPGQTPEKYRQTLERVLSLDRPPEHISAYSLIIEEGTPFYDRCEAGCLMLPDEDEDRLMYQETQRILWQKGYRRYEISNYAKEGYECRHNCGYWRRKNYAGFGIGAASLVENRRFQNGRDLGKYLEKPMECREECRLLDSQEQMEEFMFLGLRMTEGVSPAEFGRLFGRSMEEIYGKAVEKNLREGLLEARRDEGSGDLSGETKGTGVYSGRLALTERGLDLSNYVMAQFLLT